MQIANSSLLWMQPITITLPGGCWSEKASSFVCVVDCSLELIPGQWHLHTTNCGTNTNVVINVYELLFCGLVWGRGRGGEEGEEGKGRKRGRGRRGEREKEGIDEGGK